MIIFNHNGKIWEPGNTALSFGNRSFRYGDGIFETIKIYNNKILNLELHYARLKEGCKILGLEFNWDQKKLQEEIFKTTPPFSGYKDFRIRFTLFRSGYLGYYTPQKNNFEFVIATTALSNLKQPYPFNQNGLKLKLYKEITIHSTPLTAIKTNNSLPYVLAGKFAKESQCDAGLLLNSSGRIAETHYANIFIIKNGNIYTPPVSEGCVAGVMRRAILNFNKNIKEKPLSIKELLDAEEVFLTNAIKGIQWVELFEDKLYKNKQVAKISKELNNLIH